MERMLEVRWHGRGGQGAWTASELLARAAIHEGKFIQSFPEFGPERMGAPVTAFTRISDKSIMVHCMVYNPDVVAVLDPTLIKAVPVIEGLNEEGNVIVNSTDSPANVKLALKADKGKFWTVPATEIAIKTLGRPIMNTALLGAVVRVTGIVSLESVEKVVKERFTQNIAEKNIAVVKQAYEEAKSE
jgi:pyruvate ferredoxin oxidoreductase gamma subunit